MTSAFTATHRLRQMFDGKIQEFISDIDNIHMVWLEEIQQEANRMFSSDFSDEPELMPKTPSQRKGTRRRRISSGRLEETRAKRRFSKGKRSNLRGSSVKTLNLIAEVDGIPEDDASEVFTEEPKRTTRKTRQTQPEVAVSSGPPPAHSSLDADLNPVPEKEPVITEDVADGPSGQNADVESDGGSDSSPERQMAMPAVSVAISAAERRSAEVVKHLETEQADMRTEPTATSSTESMSAEMDRKPVPSPGRTATKIAIAAKNSRRSSVRHSLVLRRSLAGLRLSMTQESIRRASRRSFLKKKARLGNSTCSSTVSDDACDTNDDEAKEDEEQLSSEESLEAEKLEASPEEKVVQEVAAPLGRVTRSKTMNTPTMPPPASIINKGKTGTQDRGSGGSKNDSSPDSAVRPSQSLKRGAGSISGGSPRKRVTPPKKSQTSIRPNMRTFLQTVQKNQLLMMTPSSVGRSAVIKSFIKHTTPLKVDPKERERQKLEALRKKQEQEEERKKKMEEDKKKKQEELKKKRDERIRRVVEARVKEEQREEEKKKKIEQKMAQMDEKNDKLRVERLAEEKAKKKVATKRQEELEQRRKQEEEARKKKIQQAEEEEIRQQKLLAKRKAEEEEYRARKLAEARRAQEQQERERELERERQAAAERQRLEKEKALALQRELEKAAREKERRELEEKRKELEEKKRKAEEEKLDKLWAAKQKELASAAANAANADIQNAVMKTPVGKSTLMNVTIDIEKTPQSYEITPKGGNKPPVTNSNPDDYGMDQNSDDSTDDESAPRKVIPSWAQGASLKQTIMQYYYHPVDLYAHFEEIEPPKLEDIFYKTKPRYHKRTSSAVWRSPPRTALGNAH